MILTKEQTAEMLEAAKPLMQWLSDNCHPHCSAHVGQVTIEVVEGLAMNRLEDCPHCSETEGVQMTKDEEIDFYKKGNVEADTELKKLSREHADAWFRMNCCLRTIINAPVTEDNCTCGPEGLCGPHAMQEEAKAMLRAMLREPPEKDEAVVRRLQQ